MLDHSVNRVLRLLFLLSLLALLCGCQSILRQEESEGGAELPWNSPAGWEDKVIGVPY